MLKEFFAEGYREDEIIENSSNLISRLFICNEKELIIAKTNISDSLNKNFTILLDDIQRIDDNTMFDEIYLVGDSFFEIHQDILEELKTKCFEVWTLSSENFNLENILKNFTNKN